MTQTISRLYVSYDDALRAALALKEAGFADRELSLLANPATAASVEEAPNTAAEDAGTGASVGGVVGAAAGLMAGMGVLAIPGIGPVVAAGWLASTLAVGAAGAVAGGALGGIVGALNAAGTSEEDASHQAKHIRHGESLVTVRVPDDRAPEAVQLLAEFPSVDSATTVEEFHAVEADGSADAAAHTYAVPARDPVLPAGLPHAAHRVRHGTS